MNYYGAVQTSRDLLFQRRVQYCLACDKNGTLITRVLIHTCVSPGGRRARKPTMKSVNEWEGADRVAGAVVAEDMASVHLSISKHSQLSSLFTGGEVNPFFFSPPAPLSLSFSLPQLVLQTHLSSCHLSFYTSLSHFTVFFQGVSGVLFPFHSTLRLTIPSFLFYSQWNSAFSNKTKLPGASHAG